MAAKIMLVDALFRDCSREPNALQKAVAINSLATIQQKEKK